jgi:hypothetical protein
MRIREIFDEQKPRWMEYPMQEIDSGLIKVTISSEEFSPVPEIILPFYNYETQNIQIKLRLDSMELYFDNTEFWIGVEFEVIGNIYLSDLALDQTPKKRHFQIIAPIVKAAMEALEIDIDPNKRIHGLRDNKFNTWGPSTRLDDYDDSYSTEKYYTTRFEVGQGYHMVELLRKWNVNP